MSLPIVITPLDGGAFGVKVADGSSGLVHSNGVFAPDASTALACVASLLGVEHPVSVESNTLTAMKERLAK